MITPKIKTLFQFIEYLHSNITNFNQYIGLIKELETLKDEKNKLKPEQNYKDKLQYNKVQAELERKFKTLQDNTANLIKAKAKELNVCSFENEPRYNFNGVETEIRQLKKNFSNEDLPEIFKHKSQYLEYRSNTHGTFLSLQFFFNELDEITKSLFDYFKDTQQNEFEHFETKAIPVNNISEAVQGFKQGQTKFIIPNLLDKTQNRIQEQIADFSFFQIEVVADLEFEGEIYKNVKQRNNDSILTPENWEQHKETFFSQRMATYKDSYTLAEKIKLELSSLEKLPTNKTDYKILKDRYRAYLEQKQALPPQPIIESPFSVLEWATIFYYADETKLLPENRTIKARIEQFINKYEINTTVKYFRTQYYEAKKRINEKNDYPINKLELIIPFLKENYKQTVTKVENDIIFLEENMPEY